MRRKNAKEMFGGFFKNMVKSADEVLISGIKVGASAGSAYSMCMTALQTQCRSPFPNYLLSVCLFPTQEVDDFFEQEKTFLLDYYSKIKDSTAKAEKMTRAHKSMRGFFYVYLNRPLRGVE